MNQKLQIYKKRKKKSMNLKLTKTKNALTKTKKIKTTKRLDILLLKHITKYFQITITIFNIIKTYTLSK